MGIAIVGFHLVSSIRTPSARQSTLFEHMELPYATNATPCNLAATIGHSPPPLHPRNTRAQNEPTKSETNPSQSLLGAVKNAILPHAPHV